MNTFRTLIQALQDSELSQVYTTGETPDDLQPKEARQLIRSLDLGMSALYSRFRLKDGRVTLRHDVGIENYELDRDFAESNDTSLELTKYLIDLDSPYQDDAIRLEEVLGEDGDPLPLNDGDYEAPWHMPELGKVYVTETLRTPTPLSLWVPSDKELGDLTVLYRARHAEVDVDAAVADLDSVEVELPQEYWQALFYYVASRVYSPMYRAGEMHEGNNWAARYEQECQRLEMNYLVVASDDRDGDTFRRAGWV